MLIFHRKFYFSLRHIPNSLDTLIKQNYRSWGEENAYTIACPKGNSVLVLWSYGLMVRWINCAFFRKKKKNTSEGKTVIGQRYKLILTDYFWHQPEEIDVKKNVVAAKNVKSSDVLLFHATIDVNIRQIITEIAHETYEKVIENYLQWINCYRGSRSRYLPGIIFHT